MPDYFVPSNRPKNDVRCPHCGSTRLFPTSGIENRMKIYQCGQCGARYQLNPYGHKPHLPTWSETWRDPVVILGAIITLVIVIVVFL